MSVEVKDTDRGWEAVVSAFDDSPGASVKFGSVGAAAAADHISNDGKPSGMTTAGILAVHEFGVGVPERSVVRVWVDSNHAALGDAFRTGVLDQLSGNGTTEKTLDRIGKVGAEGMRRRIRGFIEPALSARTQADPNRDPRMIPLYDTQQIIDSIDREVEK